MSELSFLLDLLLNHKLPKPTKEAITGRVKEVEANLISKPQNFQVSPQTAHFSKPAKTAQSPSTQKILDEIANENGVFPTDPISVDAPIVPAYDRPDSSRSRRARSTARAIRIAASGKEEKGRTSPRKF